MQQGSFDAGMLNLANWVGNELLVVLAGLILGAIAAFIIDRKFDWAALFAATGAVLSFFGFIHGTSLGIGNSAPVALGYLIVASVCYALSRQNYPQAVVISDEEPAHAVGED